MKRLLTLTLLTAACATPLERLKIEAERGNAYTAEWTEPPNNIRCVPALSQLIGVVITSKLNLVIQDLDTADAHGYADYKTGTITIAASLNPCGKAEILSHELAHFYRPGTLWGADNEVFADAVSYLFIKKTCGYDPMPRYASYLSQYKHSGHVLILYRTEIDSVVALFMKKR